MENFDLIAVRSNADVQILPQLEAMYELCKDEQLGECINMVKDRRDLLEHAALHPRDTWSEEDGDVLWYRLPIEEPPYCGTPNSSDWPECPGEPVYDGYYTHWQRLPPLPKTAARYP